MKIQIKKYPFLILMLLTSGIALCVSDEIGFPEVREHIAQIIEQQKTKKDADTDKSATEEAGNTRGEDTEEKNREQSGTEGSET